MYSEERIILCHRLNREHVHLGIVTDAGKPIGVISMEDILEELVDDIAEDNSIKKARKAA